MEGLHHDTNLEPLTSVPLDSSKIKDELETEDTTPETPLDLKNDDFASASVNQTLSAEEKIGFYDQMVRIRRFEERSLRAYQQGHIGGFLHLYIGQAVAVGSVSVLGKDDHVITAYRTTGTPLLLV